MMKTYAIYQNLLAQVERVFHHCRKQGLNEHTACRHISRLLEHEREDVTRIYLTSLQEGGERHG